MRLILGIILTTVPILVLGYLIFKDMGLRGLINVIIGVLGFGSLAVSVAIGIGLLAGI